MPEQYVIPKQIGTLWIQPSQQEQSYVSIEEAEARMVALEKRVEFLENIAGVGTTHINTSINAHVNEKATGLNVSSGINKEDHFKAQREIILMGG